MEGGAQCELCKNKVFLKFVNKHGCASCSRTHTKIKNNKPLFILFLIFLMLNGSTLSYMIYYAITNS